MSKVITVSIEKALELIALDVATKLEYQKQVAALEPYGVWWSETDNRYLAAGTSASAAQGRVFGIPENALVELTLSDEDFDGQIAELQRRKDLIKSIIEQETKGHES